MREDKGRGIEGSVLKYGTDKEKKISFQEIVIDLSCCVFSFFFF